MWCGASGGTSRPKRVSLVARTLEVGDTLHLSNGVRRWTGEMAQPDTTTPAPPSLREVKAYLSAARVDFSDCFERTELIERFRAVQLERQVTDVEQMKAKANAAFKRQSYEYAVRMYTDAVLATDALHAVDQSRARSLQVQLLSNRSRAYMELGIPLAAMEDAQRCLQLDPAFLKAYHRLAAAHTSLRRCAPRPAHPSLPRRCVLTVCVRAVAQLPRRVGGAAAGARPVAGCRRRAPRRSQRQAR